MDHCLRIPELVHSICRQVDKAGSLSLALVCQAFLDPALDQIWRDIKSLQPLISCLPGDIWKDDGEQLLRTDLRRSLTSDDLRRYVTLYAYRIQSISPYLKDTRRHLSAEVLQTLQTVTDHRPGALSPRLHTFHWDSAPHYSSTREYPVGFFDPYISLFVGESVESLEILQTRDDPVYLGSLSLTMRRLPHLKKLTVDSLKNNLSFTSQLITLFPWQSLEGVYLGCASREIIAALARIPGLRNLGLRDIESATLPPLAEALPERPAALNDFASLRVVNIMSWALISIKALLQAASPRNRIERVVSSRPTPADISDSQSTISAIQRYCNADTLRSIKVVDTRSRGWRPKEQLDMYPDCWEADLDISGLSNFTNLQELVVRWQKSVQLSPREIALIPTWWPYIQHLDLCQQYPSLGRMPAIDHTHLLDLVRGCPLLRFLGLRFDTTQIPGEHQGPAETFRLKVLRVGESPIVSPSRVAAFLKRHLPRLEKLDFDFETIVKRETSLLDRRWAAVAEALR